MTHSQYTFRCFKIIAFLLAISAGLLSAQGIGRVAVVADGNYRDTDDICGTPVSLGILHSFGFADRLVHYSHSCDITPAGNDAGQGDEAARERAMQVSCDGTADRWGAFPNVTKFYNCKREYAAAVSDLTSAINASSGNNLLYIIEAGEPDVIYDAMVAATQSRRQHIRIVTHHPNNDRGDQHDLSDIQNLSGFSSNGVIRIPDQNSGLKTDLNTWHWARDHDDHRLNWLWDRGAVAEDQSWGYRGIRGSFDCSDAGMIWFWATGEDDCSVADLRSTFTTFIEADRNTTASEAEDATISNGEIKDSFDAAGQRLVDGSAGFNLTWFFDATAASYDLDFFISAPSGNRSMGVFVNGSKVGTVSAGASWIRDTVTTNLRSGENTIELRDSENSAELNVDMVQLRSASGIANPTEPQELIFDETDGLVVMEIESTTSPLDLWEQQSSLRGSSGNGYLQFLGNTFISGPARSPLEYRFKINQGGLYFLHMHCAKETHDGRTDVANDCFVRVEGDYTSGPGPHNSHNDNASLTLLRNDTKYFGGNTDRWKWEDGDANLDPGGDTNKRVAVYNFKAGETYRLVLSGRSKFFRINRLVFRRSSVAKSTAENLSRAESPRLSTNTGSNDDSAITYNALADFSDTTGGDIDYYEDNPNQSLAIDASIVSNRTGFARASRTFSGPDGNYQIRITTLTEEDGESTYRLLVNGVVVETFTNPYVGEGSALDLQAWTHVWHEISLENGDTISVESNAVTNGEIPEDGGTAYSRGRWQQLEILPNGTLPAPRTQFDFANDLLIAQFDSKPDADDIHAQAALGSMIAHPDLQGLNYFAVAGAIGRQGGAFIDSRSLFRLAFGTENVDWTNAAGGSANRNASITRIRDRARSILDAGGRVWVQEAGQSDLTRDWIAALISAGVSEAVIKANVIIVQHSLWNEDQTTPADLTYVRQRANYVAIDDGNVGFLIHNDARPDRGNPTPGYVSAENSWINEATSSTNPNTFARTLWTEADRIIEDSGFDAGYSEIPDGGVDFSDCVENWWIFQIGSDADSLADFWNRYVVNLPTTNGNPASPIGHWPLDEASGTLAADISGNQRDGTLLNGASWASDSVRSSYVSFDGNNDRIETPFTYSLNTQDDFTWAWWANKQTPAGSDDSAIMVGNRYPDGGDPRFRFIKLTPTGGQFAFTGTSGSIDRYNYSAIPQGQWHHYAMVKSGNSYQWYVDGVAQGTPVTLGYSSSAAIPFFIGGDDNGNNRTGEHFQGCIDDVVLYQRALTPEDLLGVIGGVYTPVVTLSSLGGRVDWSSGNVWSDQSAAHPGADYRVPASGNLISPTGSSFFPGDSLTILSGGKLQIRSLDSQNASTIIPDLIFEGGNNFNPGNFTELSAGEGSSDTNVLDGTITNSGTLRILTFDETNGNPLDRNLIIRSQINGDGTIQMSEGQPNNGGSTVTITNENNTFSGTWETRTGSALVFENAGSVGDADIEVSAGSSLEIQGNWNTSKSLTVSDSAGTQVDLGAFGWSVANLSVGGVALPQGVYTASDLNDFSNTQIFAGIGTLVVGSVPADGPLARWSFDEGSGTVAIDSSGNGHLGTLTHGPTWASDATRSSFLSFDGSNDRVSTSFTSALSNTDDFTWLWWAKRDRESNNSAVILGNRYPQGGPRENLEFIKLTPTGAQFANGENGSSVERHDYTVPVDGDWHHYALVKSGTSYQLYLDGQLSGDPSTINYNETAPIPFAIGGDDDNGTAGGREREHFEGGIDDVILYGRALTPAEVISVRNNSSATSSNTQLEDWRLTYFGTTANSGQAADDADANSDGESNILEFATGQDPTAATLVSTPIEVTSNGLQFRYTRSKAAMAEGMTFVVTWSESLRSTSWQTTGISEAIDAENAAVQEIIASAPANSQKRFIRLEVRR